jgi:cell division protein ZapB
VVALKSGQHEASAGPGVVDVGGGEPLSAQALAGLGLEGDTEKDVVATLIGEVRNMKAGIDQLRQDNTALRADNAQLKGMEQTIGRRVETQLLDAEKTAVDNAEAGYRSMLRRLEEAERRLEQSQVQYGGAPPGGRTPSETVWVQPLGRDGAGNSAGNSVGSREGGNESGNESGQGGLLARLSEAGSGLRSTMALDALPGRQGRASDKPAPVPFYTIARNATLVNSTAMTALVGRVPIGGQVTDPYSFKVIIGRDNLMANGIELPDVAYSIASGKAVGDWTLGCVRGDLYSLTFVFEDGTIRTVPKAEDIYEGTASQRDVKIGELSDAFGNPCVVGQRITNAYTYLAQRIGVVSVSAAAEAAAASQTTQITSVDGSGTGVTTTVDGSTTDFILGQSIADGSMEVARWLDERQAQQFDAIYVKPGAKVAMHITEQITIDYDPEGRKTNFAAFGTGGYRVLD